MNPDAILQYVNLLNMHTALLSGLASNVQMNSNSGYIAGAVIAVIILGYLFYTLFKPDKL